MNLHTVQTPNFLQALYMWAQIGYRAGPHIFLVPPPTPPSSEIPPRPVMDGYGTYSRHLATLRYASFNDGNLLTHDTHNMLVTQRAICGFSSRAQWPSINFMSIPTQTMWCPPCRRTATQLGITTMTVQEARSTDTAYAMFEAEVATWTAEWSDWDRAHRGRTNF